MAAHKAAMKKSGSDYDESSEDYSEDYSDDEATGSKKMAKTGSKDKDDCDKKCWKERA